MRKNAFVKPTVSVIMPVYNAGSYLKSAIDSVLDQEYTDFEFIIINDGSTDDSLKTIKKYAEKDSRIKLFSRKNEGYASALNWAIDLSNGKYIARMDADDISQKDRFKEQVTYLDKHPECAVLACRIQPVDENSSPISEWEADRIALEPKQIRSLMIKENCIAHPSIMARASIMHHFRYDASLSPSEDYDLWLRLLSDNFQIHKLNQKLVLYRIHSASVSQTSIRQTSVQRKYLTVKSRFLAKQLRRPRLGPVEIKVGYSLLGLVTLMTWSKVNNLVHKLVTKRLVIVTRYKKALKNKSSGRRILLIMPWMTAGGADKVFLDLAMHLRESGYQVFCITTVPSKNEWRKFFERASTEVVVADEKFSADKIPQFIVDYSTRNKIETVVTSNNAAGYLSATGLKMSNPQIRIVDIIHGQGGKFEKGGWPLHSAPFDKYLDKRIVVTEYMKKYLIEKYKIPAPKIKVIHNGIKINKEKFPKAAKEFKGLEDKFIVLWAGRFNEEKHPELAIETAKLVCKESDDIRFIMVGDGEMKSQLLEVIDKYGLGGKVIIAAQPYEDYREFMAYSDILLMTSEMEGLPIVILEALASGLPVIAPSVGGIPEIVTNEENGYLLGFSKTLPRRAAEKILYLSSEVGLAKRMGNRGLRKIEQGFNYKKMMDKYDEIIL